MTDYDTNRREPIYFDQLYDRLRALPEKDKNTLARDMLFYGYGLTYEETDQTSKMWREELKRLMNTLEKENQ